MARTRTSVQVWRPSSSRSGGHGAAGALGPGLLLWAASIDLNASFLLEQMVSLHGGGLGGDVALDALDISRDGDARRLGGGGETA